MVRPDVVRRLRRTLDVVGGSGGRPVGLSDSLAAEVDEARQLLAALGIDGLAQHAYLAVEHRGLFEHVFEVPQRHLCRCIHSVDAGGGGVLRLRRLKR